MAVNLIELVWNKTWLDKKVIRNVITLLDEWNTIPFIARYRKELTQGATDEQLRDFNEVYTYTKNLEARKEDVIRLIDEKWLLTDELRQQIMDAETLARVEDLYRPFKEKKNTRATIAKAKWLDPLADILRKAELSKEDFESEAVKFVKDTEDAKTTVKDVAEAISWAQDIIAEDVSKTTSFTTDVIALVVPPITPFSKLDIVEGMPATGAAIADIVPLINPAWMDCSILGSP